MRSGLASAFLGVAIVALPACEGDHGGIPPALGLGAARAQVATASAGLDLAGISPFFVENRGQLPSDVAYYVAGRRAQVSFASTGLTLVLLGKEEKRPGGAGARHLSGKKGATLSVEPSLDAPRPPHTLKLEFLGADPAVRPAGADRKPTRINLYQGTAAEGWRTGLSTYGRILYRGIWPGIDLEYAGGGDRVKYAFRLKAGASPAQIRMAWRGASGMRTNKAGALEVFTPAGTFEDQAPTAYQDASGRRVKVPVSYVLGPNGSHEYGFKLGAYDPSLPLVIDPAFTVYAGFLGTEYHDRGLGIAVDADGAAYVTGQIGKFDWWTNDTADVYVAKISPDGTYLEYVTILGGWGVDQGFDIAVDKDGYAYATGATFSGNFPVLGGPDLTFNGGYVDAFVAKLDPWGGLVYSGYLGGAGNDFAEGIAIDEAGDVYLTGVTSSGEIPAAQGGGGFPATVGPDATYNGNYDTFVCKLRASPTLPVYWYGSYYWYGYYDEDLDVKANYDYCGYIGGSEDDIGIVGDTLTASQIAVDPAGSAYVSGDTRSSEATFPNGHGFGSIPGFDRTHNGGYDAYIVKVRPDGTGLAYATYIGGAGDELANGMAVDLQGNAYISGQTSSDQSTFPVFVGPDLTYNGGILDAFVAKLNPQGTGLVYAGYLGGEYADTAHGLTLDKTTGSLYVVGYSDSTEATFPAVGGPDLTMNNVPRDEGVPPEQVTGDAIVCKLKPNPVAPSDPADEVKVRDNYEYCGFIGGRGDDHAYWVALDPSNNAYVVGDTYSDEHTFPDGEGFGCLLRTWDQTAGGDLDGFVLKISGAPPTVPPGVLGVAAHTTLAADQVNGIVVTADGAKLDCQGFSVFPGVFGGVGICAHGRSKVEISNCNVQDFLVGFDLMSTRNSTLSNNSATGWPMQSGFELSRASGDRLEDNTASGIPMGFGFNLFDASGNVLEGNAANGDGVGFRLVNGSGNVLRGNSANDTANAGYVFMDEFGYGFSLTNTSRNLVELNTANRNFRGGFQVVGTENTVRENTANDSNPGGKYNAGIGFWLDGSGNVLSGNLAAGNPATGFRLGLGDDNVVEKNRSERNGISLSRSSGGEGFITYLHSGGSGNAFRKNRADHNVRAGFQFWRDGYPSYPTGVLVSQNIATGNGLDGFEINGVQGVSFEKNRARGNAGSGFNLAYSMDNSFDQNASTENAGDGFTMRSYPTSGNTFTGNSSRKDAGGGFVMDWSGRNNTFIDNLSSDSGGDGFRIFGFDNNLARNLARDYGGYGFFDGTTGQGTAGTGNSYSENRCPTRDGRPGSLPAGLCLPAPPSLTILYPAGGELVSGTILVEVAALDAKEVRYYVDDVFFAKSSKAPYSVVLDTATIAQGPHVLLAEAVGPDQLVASAWADFRVAGINDPCAIVDTASSRFYSQGIVEMPGVANVCVNTPDLGIFLGCQSDESGTLNADGSFGRTKILTPGELATLSTAGALVQMDAEDAALQLLPGGHSRLLVPVVVDGSCPPLPTRFTNTCSSFDASTGRLVAAGTVAIPEAQLVCVSAIRLVPGLDETLVGCAESSANGDWGLSRTFTTSELAQLGGDPAELVMRAFERTDTGERRLETLFSFPVEPNGPCSLAPVANDQDLTTALDTPLSITLSASDRDTPASQLVFSVVSPPAQGTLSGTAPDLTYTPVTGFSGTDAFTFKASDGVEDSNLATVTIHVTATATSGLTQVCAAQVAGGFLVQAKVVPPAAKLVAVFDANTGGGITFPMSDPVTGFMSWIVTGTTTATRARFVLYPDNIEIIVDVGTSCPPLQ